MNNIYSRICNHARLQRIDNDFVRCLDCGQSMISQKKMVTNKTSIDFARENEQFIRNFDRNFTNTIDEIDQQSLGPIYEYYTDRLMMNKIIVNRQVQFNSQPPKYEVTVNGRKTYMTGDEISKLIASVNARHVDRTMIKN